MKSLRVLVVDDDPDIRELIASTFAGRVALLETAESAEAGLSKIEKIQFDVVLLDNNLPGMNGVEALARIKTDQPKMEVVMMTANADLDVALQALRSGASDFLIKPFESVQILRVVLARAAEKLRLHNEINIAHSEITGLYQFYMCLQLLAAALTYSEVFDAAVRGLSRLTGKGKTVLFAPDEGSDQLAAISAHPHEAPDGRLPVTLGRLKELQEDWLGLARFLRGAFETKFGRVPIAAYALSVGGNPRAVLVLEESGRPEESVSDDVQALFIQQIEMALANATLYEKMQELSMRDPLTGLFNHRYFQDRLNNEIARAARHGHALSLLFIDIDNFKNLNDTQGHLVGDQVLIGVGELLRGRTSDLAVLRSRTSDIAARYGGEEFVLILPETPLDGALIKAERVRRAIEAAPLPGREVQPSGRITVSIGVSCYPDHASDKRSLIDVADRCLYVAKNAGKNRVVSPNDSAGD